MDDSSGDGSSTRQSAPLTLLRRGISSIESFAVFNTTDNSGNKLVVGNRQWSDRIVSTRNFDQPGRRPWLLECSSSSPFSSVLRCFSAPFPSRRQRPFNKRVPFPPCQLHRNKLASKLRRQRRRMIRSKRTPSLHRKFTSGLVPSRLDSGIPIFPDPTIIPIACMAFIPTGSDILSCFATRFGALLRLS